MELPKLTHKEQIIYETVLNGNSLKMVAHVVGLAEATVKVHLRNIFKKFGVNNRNELIAIDRNYWKSRALEAEKQLTKEVI